MKTDIKLQVTSEQSEVIQKICIFNKIYWKDTGSTLVENVKYIFISANSMTLSYQYRFFNNHSFEEVNPELFIRTNGTCIEPIEECQFAKYGFEKPDFECEIWKVEASVSFKYIHGLVLNDYAHPMGNLEYHKWNKKTGEVLVGCSSKNLTPIKKPWYETCKFPVLVWDGDEDNDLLVIETRGDYASSYLEMCKPLTNDEIEGLKQ